MNQQIIIGLVTEGSTDVRFLESIIQRTFEEVAPSIDVLPIEHIKKESGGFIEVVTKYARKAYETGIMILCVHNDADGRSDLATFANKIVPAFDVVLQSQGENICKNMIAIVPVQMTEAWMLADKALLKKQLGTSKADSDLGIHKDPEAYANPKKVISDAIRIAFEDWPKRRKRLDISELYSPIGQSIMLPQLRLLPSYCKFEETVKRELTKLNYLTG